MSTGRKIILYIVYVLIIIGLSTAVFWGFHTRTKKPISSMPAKPGTTQTTKANSSASSSTSKTSGQTSSTATTTPNAPAAASSSTSTATATAPASSTAATSTTDAAALTNTGPGDVAGLFITVSLGAGVAYRVRMSRQLAR